MPRGCGGQHAVAAPSALRSHSVRTRLVSDQQSRRMAQNACISPVATRFVETWGRTGKLCPSVRCVYKILSQRDIQKRYETYRYVVTVLVTSPMFASNTSLFRSMVEERGRFVTLGKAAGNETHGWHGTRRACQLGNSGPTEFCSSPACSLCSIVTSSFDIGYGATALGFGLGWEM